MSSRTTNATFNETIKINKQVFNTSFKIKGNIKIQTVGAVAVKTEGRGKLDECKVNRVNLSTSAQSIENMES